MLSLLILSIDRYKILKKTSDKRISMHLMLPLLWVLSLFMVLPYSAYISHFYLDVSYQYFKSSIVFFLPIQDLGPGFAGGEFCVVNLTGNVADYMRVLFFLL